MAALEVSRRSQTDRCMDVWGERTVQKRVTRVGGRRSRARVKRDAGGVRGTLDGDDTIVGLCAETPEEGWRRWAFVTGGERRSSGG